MDIVRVLLDIMLLGSEWVLWLLIVLSVISVSVMIERAIFFSRIRIDFPKFMDELQKHLLSGELSSIKSLCESSPALESQVVLRGLEHKNRGAIAMQETMTGWLLSERVFLDRGLVILGTLGNNAPFIGLFGTVLGI